MREEKELGKERIVTPPEETKERVRKGRERREKEKRRMSSKGHKRDSEGGLRNDPKDNANKLGEDGALRGDTLVDTLGVLDEGAIERLLDESAKGYSMRAEQGSLRGSFPRENVVSQCREAMTGSAEDAVQTACDVGGEQDSQHLRHRKERSDGVVTNAPPLVSGSRWTLSEASRRQAFEECRQHLATTCRRKDLRFEELGKVLLVQEQMYTRCSKTKGDLFPLPLPSSLEASSSPVFCADALVQALNSLYGTKTIERYREDSARLNLVGRLKKVVEESDLGGCEVPELEFGEFFKNRSVDYSGEIVQVARRFDWRMIEASIEAAFPEAVGSLNLEDFCEGGTLAYVQHFEEFLLPPQDQHLGKMPSIMVEACHWAEVCSGLLRRGVCRLMRVRELHHRGRRPLLNGLFAVSKQEQATDTSGNVFEVCRLIMNLVPTNGCCRSLVGDTSTLPSVIGMSSIVLDDNQLLVTSSEDIRCFFYLFRTPAGREVPAEALPDGFEGTGWHLVTWCCPWGS